MERLPEHGPASAVAVEVAPAAAATPVVAGEFPEGYQQDPGQVELAESLAVPTEEPGSDSTAEPVEGRARPIQEDAALLFEQRRSDVRPAAQEDEVVREKVPEGPGVAEDRVPEEELGREPP